MWGPRYELQAESPCCSLRSLQGDPMIRTCRKAAGLLLPAVACKRSRISLRGFVLNSAIVLAMMG